MRGKANLATFLATFCKVRRICHPGAARAFAFRYPLAARIVSQLGEKFFKAVVHVTLGTSLATSGPLAQYSELATDNRLVGSSSPPSPTTNLLGALYAALRIETPTYKRCDGGAMYHQEKGEAFSATAPYLSLGGTEQSTRWRNPMGKSGRSNKKGRPNKRTKRLMKLEEKRRRNASRRKSVRP